MYIFSDEPAVYEKGTKTVNVLFEFYGHIYVGFMLDWFGLVLWQLYQLLSVI